MATEVFSYTFNPGCDCAWCRNGGKNPRPKGYYAALGYDVPHYPPPGPRKTHLSDPPPGQPGAWA